MIESVETIDAAFAPVKWWAKVPRLQQKVTFAPGLNVLLGPNGSGKSTLIVALGKLFHCVQGGVPTVTHRSMDWIPDGAGLRVLHDALPVCCLRTEDLPGLIGGLAGFDDDFYSDGIASMKRMQSSHGQQTLARLPEIAAKFDAVTEVKWKCLPHPHMGHKYLKKLAAIKAFLETPTIAATGRKTLLLDEPEDGLSVPMQARMWLMLGDIAKKHQVIVATQSPLAFALQDATYVETVPGFREECLNTVVGTYAPQMTAFRLKRT